MTYIVVLLSYLYWRICSSLAACKVAISAVYFDTSTLLPFVLPGAVLAGDASSLDPAPMLLVEDFDPAALDSFAGRAEVLAATLGAAVDGAVVGVVDFVVVVVVEALRADCGTFDVVGTLDALFVVLDFGRTPDDTGIVSHPKCA